MTQPLLKEARPLTLETPAEHPFAEFVRILGKGKRGARGLTADALALPVQVLDAAALAALIARFDQVVTL